MKNVDIKLITRDDLDDILAISGESFPAEYNVTKANLMQKLIDDADKFDEGSLILREAISGKPIGFIGTKISHSELYPDTGWISIVAVARDYRRNGYGRLLVSKALEALHSAGVNRVSVGQEFHNFFSVNIFINLIDRSNCTLQSILKNFIANNSTIYKCIAD